MEAINFEYEHHVREHEEKPLEYRVIYDMMDDNNVKEVLDTIEQYDSQIKKEDTEEFHYVSPCLEQRGLNITDIYHEYKVHVFTRNKHTTSSKSMNLVVFMEDYEDEEATLEMACMDMLTTIDSKENFNNHITYENPHRFYHCTCLTTAGALFRTCELLPIEYA